MLDAIRRRFAAHMHRQMRRRGARRFVRQQDGVAAVEFALVAAPFLGLMFAIFETALLLFADQQLEAAVANAGRLILTGQAQTAGWSQGNFKTQVCAQLSSMFDCANGVYVNVQTYSSFSSIGTTPPITKGKFDPTNITYNPGNPGNIVVVSLYYQWPIYVTFFGDNLGNLLNGSRLLVATSVFRVEPYQ